MADDALYRAKLAGRNRVVTRQELPAPRVEPALLDVEDRALGA